MERLLLVLLSGCVGIIIGLFGPTLFGPAQQAVRSEQDWLYPITPTPAPTSVPLVLPRPTAAQTGVPPTLRPFAAATAPPPPPTPVPAIVPGAQPPSAHTFTIRLQGGGEMTVVANDEAAARNNVKSQGGVPAD